MKIKAQIDRFIGKDNRVKAYASVILGGEYVIRDIAVMDSKNGLFARMPYRSYKDRNGNMQYLDVAFALNETSRNAISDAFWKHTSSGCTWRKMSHRTLKSRRKMKLRFSSRNCDFFKKLPILAGHFTFYPYPCSQR